MTVENRLATTQRAPRMSPQEAVDRGNSYLAEIGRAHEVHWYLHNGRPVIGWAK